MATKIAGVVMTVTVGIGSDYVTLSMTCFFMWTALWQGCCAMQCFTYVILLREPRAKSRTTLRVSIVTTTQNDY
ncbi:unnamed protein product, partial [Mesorhabditis belari]|uniref:Uncharacterized protein n=1 Tax=Mesorhabditis belari TaxID=2138241 RepID=A0AAF3ENF6_9BILA